ncbi:beta-ribofuranosylaminobenzene 5'-phosphate synthase family protein [Halobellus ruber]|uniref:Beta-ribofuranosylaminobenzene 5'-phosphate synthase n=1 Tax=Halobellus ruber TaxID=2761102 RepID=A0A7J9SFU8_9EURY|nr:beta-ribofuranosylaminobenzene 5'-phosphate synthase family protein [Halobellus ruber]MBB6645253.1 GHMP kinase [Halobellus ruber]
MSRVRVTVGARLHVGFLNLSLAHSRLYGGIGLGLDEPRTVLTAAPADRIECDHAAARGYVERAVDRLGVSGAAVTVESALPRHAGLGSGTRLALAALRAVGRAHGLEPDVRELAPDLGRGGRSGVGVATFESGGFVIDAGHPTEQFTPDRPADGEWTVPRVTVRREIPEAWRFLVVVPDVDRGRSGEAEEESIRSVVEGADPGTADRIAGVVARRLLPAVAEGSHERFGAAIRSVGRLNGTWYAGEQGGVYRPPAGEIVAALHDDPACHGAGQSSWGPCVYAVTHADQVDAARAAGRAALDDAGVPGEVLIASGRNDGADVNPVAGGSVPRNR